MDSAYAYIENGVVTNTIIWNGVPFTPAVPGKPYIAPVAAVPEVPAVDAVPAVLDDNGNVVVPEVPGSPAIPGTPAIAEQLEVPDAPAFGWSPPDDVTLVAIGDDSGVGIGFTYDGEKFAPPPHPPEAAPTAAEILAINTSMQTQLSNSAAIAIAPLQLAVSLGEATDAETTSAKAWVAYSRALMAVDLSSRNPAWPAVPAS